MCEKPLTASPKPLSKASPQKKVNYRAKTVLVALVCLVVIAVAAWIKPNPTGVGSHTQLGLIPCGFHERTGYPCITCGMTTAFAHVVRAEFLRAFTVQPAGALAGIVCLITAVLTGLAALTGRGRDQFTHLLNVLCLHWAAVLMIATGVVLASWGWTCALTWFRTQ